MFKRYLVVTMLFLNFVLLFTPLKSSATSLMDNSFNYDSLINQDVLDSSITEKEWISSNINNQTEKNKINSAKLIQSQSSLYRQQKAAAYSMKKGDILITNGTSSKGVTGHSAIAIDSKTILHIPGPNKAIETISLKTFKSKYIKKKNDYIMIYRPKSASNANKAGDWASKNYKGKKYKYKVTKDITKKDPTYCSKIVWQAYYSGVSSKSVSKPLAGIAQPYALPSYFKKGYDVNLVKRF